MSSSNQTAPPRKSRGRQKVKMAKMENHSNLQVTFSKRRAGLFKKASELCTLCGAEAALVVFSPANKAYCFGHPNVKAVVDRLAAMEEPAPTNPRSQLIIEAHRNSNIRDLNIELTRVESLLRAERRRAEEIELLRKAGQLLPTSLDDLDYAQLCALKESVMGFKKNVDAIVQKEMFRVANPVMPNSHHHHQTENPNPSDQGFPSGGGVDNASRFHEHDYYPKLSLGFGDFPPNLNGGAEDYISMKGNNGWSGDMFDFNVGGGSSGALSSILPNDPHSTSRGGHGHGLFQMF